jgi:citrate lyase subunit beta/citryl-CoA lyase
VPYSIPNVRSVLFAPGSDARKLERALGAGADLVVADLEDAVPPDGKEAARATVAAWLGRPADVARAVRVNGADTPEFAADLEALAGLELAAIVLPKATPAAVAALGPAGPDVIAVIETAAGLRAAYETGAEPRVAALALGAADLGAELWLEPRPDGQELLYARSKLVVDSAAAGIRPPFDVVHLAVGDDAGLEAEARYARSLGLRGKLCIHPRQVAVVNRVFAPTDAEVAWAEDVVAAYRKAAGEGRGALLVNGALVDLALVHRAERILAAAPARSGGA